MNVLMMPPVTHFPLEAFPKIVREAIEEIHINVKAPLPLIASCFLGGMSAVAQGEIKVRLPSSGMPRPVSMYILIIAESGDRKTAVDNFVFKALYRYDLLMETRFREAMLAYERKHRLWKDTEKMLTRRIAKSVADRQPTADLEAQLTEHQNSEPTKPRLRRRVRQNSSERAMIDAMEGQGESLAFISNEGEILLESPLFKKHGALNAGWDGGHLLIDRANGVSVSASDIRLTISAMTQSSVVREYLRKRGNAARGTGFFSRFLITLPQSMKGYRFENDVEPSWERLGRFHQVCEEMLGNITYTKTADRDEQVVYELDDDAKLEWFNLVNLTESQMQPCGYLDDIHDFASKACEIVLRIAALFHHFSKQEGKITCDTLYRARDVVAYHIEEFKRVFSPTLAVPQAYADALALENYLRQLYYQVRGVPVPRNEVLRVGPVRPKVNFDPALQTLINAQKVFVTKDINRRSWINFNVQYFMNPPLQNI